MSNTRLIGTEPDCGRMKSYVSLFSGPRKTCTARGLVFFLAFDGELEGLVVCLILICFRVITTWHDIRSSPTFLINFVIFWDFFDSYPKAVVEVIEKLAMLSYP